LFQTALDDAARLHSTPLSEDVAHLSRLFTKERGQRSASYLQSKGNRRAYLGFFAPRNALRVAHLLVALEDEGALPRFERPSVLDLGSGPLVGVIGAWVRYGALEAATAVDLAAGAMADGRRLVDALEADLPLQTHVHSLTRAPWPTLPRADLVILANVIGELGDPRRDLKRRLGVVRRALARVRDGGRLLIVEPGTRLHGRGLMGLRDALVADGVSLVAPCTGAARCPLLARGSDWCHEEIAQPLPERARDLMRQAGLKPGPLKHSYLLLAREEQAPSARLRVVSGALRRGKDVQQLVCGRDGLSRRDGEGLRRGAPYAAEPPTAGSPTSKSRKRRGGGAAGSRGKEPTAARKPSRKDSPSSSRKRKRSPSAPRK
jgi:SAM-dependent methyltransferase